MNINKKALQSVLMVCAIFCLGFAAKRADRKGSIRIQEETVTIAGVRRDYDIMLIADTHISLCDERDPDLLEKAQARREAFEQESGKVAVRTFHNLVTEAVESDADLTVFAGDITDSAMYASIDFVQEEIGRLDMPYLYVTGNHDFEYGEEYFSKKAYREYFPRLLPLTNTTEQYTVQEYDDLIVAGINDKNNQFDKKAVQALLPYLKGTKPVILVMHVPLQPQYERSELEQQADTVWGLSKDGRCRVLLGETACKPNKTTRKLLDAVFAENSPVAAVFAGHIHFYNRSMLNAESTQFVTGAGYYGDAVRIHVQAKNALAVK
ncbi:MAG: metallophosphoesterase [Eubacterium sp.]|nr:metallophosphoesterase [Eubacterium sp.]